VDAFACHTRSLEGSCTLVSVSGDLDLHTCERFRDVVDEAREAGPAHLVFDLSQVTYIDSTALGVLVVLQRQRREPLHLVVRQRHQQRLLRMTGLDEVFAVHASLDDALTAARGRAA
jgi:anti-sigma B factor antagonist